MKTTMKAITLAVIATVSYNAAAESNQILNDRLGSAIEDNGLNNNSGTHDRVNRAYNDLKRAEGGSMDTSKAAPIDAAAPADTSATAHPDYRVEASHAHYQALAARRQQLIEAHQAVIGTQLEQANRMRTRQQVLAGGLAELNAQIAAETAAHSIADYGVKTNPQGVPINIVAASAVTAVKPAQTASINIAARTLAAEAPEAQVTATIEGVPVTTTAAALAEVAPQYQVAVPHVAMLIPRAGNAGNRQDGHSQGHSSDNNGSSNEHNSAMGGRGMSSGHSPASNF